MSRIDEHDRGHAGVIESRQNRRPPHPTASIILHRMRPRSATSGEYLRSTSVWHTEVLRRYPIDGLVILAPEVGPEARLVMISLRAVTLPRLWGQAKGGMEG